MTDIINSDDRTAMVTWLQERGVTAVEGHEYAINIYNDGSRTRTLWWDDQGEGARGWVLRSDDGDQLIDSLGELRAALGIEE